MTSASHKAGTGTNVPQERLWPPPPTNNDRRFPALMGTATLFGDGARWEETFVDHLQ